MDGTKPIGSGVKPSHKKRWVIIAVLTVLAIVGYVVFLNMRANTDTSQGDSNSKVTQKLQAKTVCSDAIIREANNPIATSDQIALGEVADKITALTDYDHDPNCLYIVLQFSLAAGNATVSSDYMNKLEQVYNSATGFSRAFTVNVVSMATLRQNVAFLVQNAKDTASSSADKSTADGSTEADKFQRDYKP